MTPEPVSYAVVDVYALIFSEFYLLGAAYFLGRFFQLYSENNGKVWDGAPFYMRFPLWYCILGSIVWPIWPLGFLYLKLRRWWLFGYAPLRYRRFLYQIKLNRVNRR